MRELRGRRLCWCCLRSTVIQMRVFALAVFAAMCTPTGESALPQAFNSRGSESRLRFRSGLLLGPPAAIVLGGCSGPFVSGSCPFHSQSTNLNGMVIDHVESDSVPRDLFCPCERIRVGKLLALSAFGATGVASRIQFAVGTLCMVDFLLGIPSVRYLPAALRRALAGGVTAFPPSLFSFPFP